MVCVRCVYGVCIRCVPAGSKVMNLTDTEDYKNDVLGLKTLNERGDYIMNSFDGPHVTYPMTWWNTVVLPMFDN